MTSPTLIAGRYELQFVPIQGTMGEVYEAHDTHLDRPVAVKLIRRDLLGGDLEHELVRRFQREARLTARAAHPGVPTVYDVGVEGSQHYLVMELVEGAAVQFLIDQGEPIPTSWIAFIGAQVCAVLARTHAISLIHRDLKPENLMLCPDGTIKVLDFGVATLVDGLQSSALTPPGATAGTARYQAPERALGIATRLSDLYSLGRVLEDMLPATPPRLLTDLVRDLTQVHPQDRPARAQDVYHRLLPLIGKLDALPGFVDRTLADPYRMYVDIAVRLPAAPRSNRRRTPVRATQPAVRQVRARAESYAADGQYRRATRLIEDAIRSMADPRDLASADLHRDLARILIEAGDVDRAVDVCATAIEALTHLVSAQHPAVMTTRLWQARAHASCGDTLAAQRLYQALLDDLCRTPGTLTPEILTVRRELALQVAASGNHDVAENMLAMLLHEQLQGPENHGAEISATREALAATRLVVSRERGEIHNHRSV